MRYLACVLCLVLPFAVFAESFQDIQARKPDLFHPETGFRIDRQRAPTPDDIPGAAKLIDTVTAKHLLDAGALAIDVFGALQSRYDELDGTWLVGTPRESLPGAIWLPEVGRGVLDATMQGYLQQNLEKHTASKDHPIIVFCVADCWMSWNAAQRIAMLGFTEVHWFRLGTDGWLDEAHTLEPIDPIPVDVD